MNKNYKIMMLIVLLVLENVVLLYLANFYQDYKKYKEFAKINSELVQSCKDVVTSDSLNNVLLKMKNFTPTARIVSDSLYLDYGTRFSESVGVALIFDKDYKLTHKACNSQWEPEIPAFQLNF